MLIGAVGVARGAGLSGVFRRLAPVALGLLLFLASCAEPRVVREDERAAAAQARLGATSDAVGGEVQRFDQAVASGIPRTQAEREAAERLASNPAVPPEVVEAVAVAAAAGVPVDEAMRLARARLEASLADVGRYRGELAVDREAARASDEGWLSLGEAFTPFLAGLIPGGAGIAAAVWAGVKAVRKARVKGENAKVAAVEAVRDSVKVGRAADPKFDEWFRANTPAARAMREALNRTPEIAAIVRRADAQKPKPPEGVAL